MLCALGEALVEGARILAVAEADLKVNVLHPQPLRLVQHRLAQRQLVDCPRPLFFLEPTER